MGKVNYNARVERKHTVDTPFNITSKTTILPKVAIIYQYVGIDQDMLLNILDDSALKGIVLAGLGDGNIPSYEDQFIKQAIKQGIVVVRASRVGSGINSDDYNNLDSLYGTIPANDLNPQKARILLMLSLMLTNNASVINKYFKTY
jgi:L-asparaginase